MGQGGSTSKNCPKTKCAECPVCPEADCPIIDCPKVECPECPECEKCPAPTECPVCPIKISNNMKVYDVMDPILNHFAPEDLQKVKDMLERDPESKAIFQGSLRSLIYTGLQQVEANERRRNRREIQQDHIQSVPSKYNQCLSKQANAHGIGIAVSSGQDPQNILKMIEDKIGIEIRKQAEKACVKYAPASLSAHEIKEGFGGIGVHSFNFKYFIAFLVLLFIFLNR